MTDTATSTISSSESTSIIGTPTTTSSLSSLNTNQTSTSTDLTDSVPMPFQDLWNSGTNGSPNDAITMNTTLPDSPSQIMVYKIEKIGESEAVAIAKKFGLENCPIPFIPSSPSAKRSVYSYSDNNTTLEVNQIGRSRLSDLHYSDSTVITLLSEEQYIDLATQYLQSKDIFPDHFVRAKGGISSRIGYTDTKSNQPPVYYPTLYTVQFVSLINEIEGYNPSAMVTFGVKEKIVKTTIFEPMIEEYKPVVLKTSEEALNLLKAYLADSSFNPPEADECSANWRGFQKLSITKVSLRYYCDDYSDYLQPVWVFQGDVQVSPKDLNTESFVGTVDAIDHQQP